MEKDKRLAVHLDVWQRSPEVVPTDVPRADVCPGVPQNPCLRMAAGPFVEVLLICITGRLDSIETPIDALLSPTVYARPPGSVISKHQQTNIETPELGLQSPRPTRAVLDDANRAAIQLGEQCLRARVEAKIAVEIGEQLDFRKASEQIVAPARCQREKILWDRAGGFCRQQFGIRSLEVCQTYDAYVCSIECTEGLGTLR
jgi:hypothetical protein